MKKIKGRKLENLEAGHKDILHVRCKIGGFSFEIILIYLASEDNDRNDKIEVDFSPRENTSSLILF